MVKNLPANAGDAGLIPRFRSSPGGGNGNSLAFLPGKSRGQRSLVGFTPWGRKESNTTEHTCTHSLPLACDQFKGGFSLLIFPLPAPPLVGHRDLGPQSRELILKVLRSSGCGDSEYGAGRSTSGWVLSGAAWSWTQLTVPPLSPAELLGQATLSVASPSRPLSRRQVCPLTPGPGKALGQAATMAIEVRSCPRWGNGKTQGKASPEALALSFFRLGSFSMRRVPPGTWALPPPRLHAPASHLPRRLSWTGPSCRMAPLSPQSPLSSPGPG